MQDATAENENLAAGPGSNNADVAERLARLESAVGDLGVVLELSAALSLEKTKILRNIEAAVTPPTTP
jgi:hypothetical protein